MCENMKKHDSDKGVSTLEHMIKHQERSECLLHFCFMHEYFDLLIPKVLLGRQKSLLGPV